MVYCVYSLESPWWGDSNENTQHTFMLKNWKDIPIMPPDLALQLTLISSNYAWSRIYFHGSKGVRAIEVLLYYILQCFQNSNWCTKYSNKITILLHESDILLTLQTLRQSLFHFIFWCIQSKRSWILHHFRKSLSWRNIVLFWLYLMYATFSWIGINTKRSVGIPNRWLSWISLWRSKRRRLLSLVWDTKVLFINH